jgi:N-acyl-D-amino-acid deacylase
MQAIIKDETREAELLESLKLIDGETVVIARAPGFDYSIGKTITQYSQAQEVDTAHGLLALMRYTRLKAVVFRKNINYGMVIDALLSEKSLLASNSPSLLETRNVIENERASKTFSKFIDICADRGIAFEWVIQKITSKPAQIFGLVDRGVIREGAVADLVVLQKSAPDKEHKGSMHALYVVVGGEVAVKEGVFQGSKNGKIIRRIS